MVRGFFLYHVYYLKRFNYGGRVSQWESVSERQHTKLRDQQILVGIHRASTLLRAAPSARWAPAPQSMRTVAVAAHCSTERGVARTSAESVGRVARSGVGRRERVSEVRGALPSGGYQGGARAQARAKAGAGAVACVWPEPYVCCVCGRSRWHVAGGASLW